MLPIKKIGLCVKIKFRKDKMFDGQRMKDHTKKIYVFN